MVVDGSAVILLYCILRKYVIVKKKTSIPLDKLFIVNVLLFEAVLFVMDFLFKIALLII